MSDPRLAAPQGWRYIGKPLKRREDLAALLGRTAYLDDLVLPGMAYLGFYRSPFAHARIKNVDTSQLASDPRVLDCVVGKDLQRMSNPMPLISAPTGCRRTVTLPIAVDRVRYVGEPVAAVVVDDKYSVEDAVERIEADFEALPPLWSPELAAESTTRIFEDWDNNVAYEQSLERGQVRKAFDGAHAIVSEKFVIGRQYGAAIEPRGVIAEYEGGFLTVTSSTQWPHFVARLLSETLNHPEGMVRVVAPDVGGGFGNKQDFYREEVVAALMAKRLRRPVKWVPARSEDLSSTVHSRAQVHWAELALGRDGKILGLKDRFLADLGAYGPMSLGPATITFISMTGPYVIENLSLQLRCVVTNTVPTGAYRGFGQPEAAFVLERLIDIAADEIGIDKAEIRRTNLAKRFPYATATGRVIDSADYVRLLERGLKLSRYASVKSSGRTRAKHIGIGLAFGLEGAGIGPSSFQDAVGARHKGYDSIRLRISPEGTVTILTGLSPHGQGIETTLSQVCADLLGVELEKVTFVRGDSRTAPYGFGTWGSRSAVLGTGALLSCIETLKGQMTDIAAFNSLKAKEDLKFASGGVRLKKSGALLYSLNELGTMAADPKHLPPGTETGLEATAYYEPPGLTITGGFHVAKVEVDLETGKVVVTKYILVHDCGPMLNPMVVEGQLHGGAAQGVGGALLEEIIYDEEGQLQTSTLIDYLIPTSLDVPDFEGAHVVTPSPHNFLGIKGMGESSIIGPAAAINNAICDALGGRVKLNKTPISPTELWERLRATKSQPSTKS